MLPIELAVFNIKSLNAGVSSGSIWYQSSTDAITSVSPVNGKPIASVQSATPHLVKNLIEVAKNGYALWRAVPTGTIPSQSCSIRMNNQAIG